MTDETSFSRGTKTLLMGPPGSGKTHSLVTYLKHPSIKKLFVLGTEPGFEESIIDAAEALNVPIDNIHWKYVSPAVESFSSLRDAARRINDMSYGTLGTLKDGINKPQYRQFFNLLDALSDFTCDRTGESFGAVDDFPADYAFGLDSLSGINEMVKTLHIGGKPCPHEGEWQVVMNFEESFINTLISNCKCFITVTCHVVKGYNQLTGAPTYTVDALGSKLGPRLPKMFSDHPYAYKEGTQFYWSTANSMCDLKNRALPISEKLQPSFVQIVDVWEKRKKLSQGSAMTSSETAA